MIVVKSINQASMLNWRDGVTEMVFAIPVSVVKNASLSDVIKLGELLGKVTFIGKENKSVNDKVRNLLIENLMSKKTIDLFQEKKQKVVFAKLAALQKIICDVEDESFTKACSFEEAHDEFVLEPSFYSAIAEKPDQDLNAEAYKEVFYKRYYPKCKLYIKAPDWVDGYKKVDGVWVKTKTLGSERCEKLSHKFKGLSFVDSDGSVYYHYNKCVLRSVNHIPESISNIINIYATMLDMSDYPEETLIESIKWACKDDDRFIQWMNKALSANWWKEHIEYLPPRLQKKVLEYIDNRVNTGLMPETDDTIVSFGNSSLFEFSVFDEENDVEDILDDEESDIEFDEEIEEEDEE